MEEDDQFLSQVLSGIAEAEVITIFFQMLKRALVIDTRHDGNTLQLVQVMPLVSSMEERITVIEDLRPQLGKVRSILGIPWIKSINSLREQGVPEQLVKRLCDADMPMFSAEIAVREAVRQLSQAERSSYMATIRGDGYHTLWSAGI